MRLRNNPGIWMQKRWYKNNKELECTFCLLWQSLLNVRLESHMLAWARELFIKLNLNVANLWEITRFLSVLSRVSWANMEHLRQRTAIRKDTYPPLTLVDPWIPWAGFLAVLAHSSSQRERREREEVRFPGGPPYPVYIWLCYQKQSWIQQNPCQRTHTILHRNG